MASRARTAHHNLNRGLGERIRPDRAVQYILAQLAGATLAAWACQCFFPPDAVTAANLGIPLPGPMIGQQGAWMTVPLLLGVEFVLTFLLFALAAHGQWPPAVTAGLVARYLRKVHPWYVDRLGEGKELHAALQRALTIDEQAAVIDGLHPLIAA